VLQGAQTVAVACQRRDLRHAERPPQTQPCGTNGRQTSVKRSDPKSNVNGWQEGSHLP
jgi:hypothetical protein